MKNLLVTVLLLFLFCQVAIAQVPVDSSDYFIASEYPSFQKNYNAHAAYVDGNRWTTSIGNRSLGRRWKNVADEFEISPEGQSAYLLGQRQRQSAPFYMATGYVLTLGSFALILPSLLFPSNGFGVQEGVGLGMMVSGLSLAYVGGRKSRESSNNFDRALWLRNRDKMLEYTSPTDQPRLRYLYETETLYLTTNSYIKNEQKHRLGLFDNNAAGEFNDNPAAWNLYKKYRTNRHLGALLYAAGVGAMIAAPSSFSSSGSAVPLMYFGGFVVSGAGLGVMFSSRRFLREAVHIRNYSVLDQKISRN